MGTFSSRSHFLNYTKKLLNPPLCVIALTFFPAKYKTGAFSLKSVCNRFKRRRRNSISENFGAKVSAGQLTQSVLLSTEILNNRNVNRCTYVAAVHNVFYFKKRTNVRKVSLAGFEPPPLRSRKTKRNKIWGVITSF